MNSRHELVAAKNRARGEHIRLLNERLTVYMTDPVRFADRIALVRERIRVLQDTPEAFSDSERGGCEHQCGLEIHAIFRATPVSSVPTRSFVAVDARLIGLREPSRSSASRVSSISAARHSPHALHPLPSGKN